MMVHSMMKDVAISFRPWEANDYADVFVRGGLRPEILDRWGILYCGDASGIEKQLERTAEDYQVSLHCESFKW
jgi:hypothetical protein